jgi:hypothetical protein
MGAKHTATPWKGPVRSGSGNYFIYAEGREQSICGVSFHDDGGANAEFIVRACNAHDALVEYFNASQALTMTLGHPKATAYDEHKAEERYEAATKAVRAAMDKAA